MPDSPPVIARAQKKRSQKMQDGTLVSFTTLTHPPAKFGKFPWTIGLILLDDGTQTLAPLLMSKPTIGMRMSPRMRLSFVTEEKLRVYEVAFEEVVLDRKDEEEKEEKEDKEELLVARTSSYSSYSSSSSSSFPGYILALTGPSGVGKTTVSLLLKRVFGEYIEKSPIVTTRSAKNGDDGEYVHVTLDAFKKLRTEEKIVAATRVPSSTEERWYGYRAEDIEKIWKEGKLPVVITEMHLLQGLSEHYGRRSILSFGLLPPGKSKRVMLSHLLHRLRARGRDTEEHIADRMKNAEEDLAFFDERKDLFDHLLVNEDLDSLLDVFRKNVPGLAEA